MIGCGDALPEFNENIKNKVIKMKITDIVYLKTKDEKIKPFILWKNVNDETILVMCPIQNKTYEIYRNSVVQHIEINPQKITTNKNFSKYVKTIIFSMKLEMGFELTDDITEDRINIAELIIKRLSNKEIKERNIKSKKIVSKKIQNKIILTNCYEIWTDGSCYNNFYGGYAGMIVNNSTLKTSYVQGGEYDSSCNRMEIMAALESLKYIKTKSNIILYTDSKFLINGATKWITSWKKNNFKNGTIKHIELWKELDKMLKKHNIIWKWVKAHKNCENNNIVDELAKKQAKNQRKTKFDDYAFFGL